MLNLSGGKSEKTRISFYTHDNGATAIRNKNGFITIEFGKDNKSFRKNYNTLIGIFSISSLVKALVLIPLIEKNIIESVWYLIPMFFYSLLAILSIIIVRKNGGKEFLRNHGAEHKVFAAYKSLGRIPTIQEANKFSRINKACGITIYSAFITSQLIGYFVYIHNNYIISEIILFLIPLFFQTVFPFNFIGKIAQFFTTSKPQNQNIELAISALSALERREFLEDILSDPFSNIFRN
jgi:uncharacterized protein YqhQ